MLVSSSDSQSLRFSLFEGGVQDVTPLLQSFTLEQMGDFFTPHDVPEVADKEARTQLFAMATFNPHTTRKKENVATLTGVVFDFDNKEEFVPIESILNRLEEKKLFYYWYTTWSHTLERPRWRLILPFADELILGLWHKVHEEAYVLIGSPPGVDYKASKDAAHVWFTPCKQPGGVFAAGASRQGWLMNPYDLHLLLTPDERAELDRRTNEDRKRTDDKTLIAPPIDSHFPDFTLKQAEQALQHIDPNCDYNEIWIKVAMALHHHFKGSEEAFKLWKQWSSKSDKYPGSIILERHWNSFSEKEEAISIGTLIHFAKQKGYQFTSLPAAEITEDIADVISEDVIFNFSTYETVDIYQFPTDLLQELHTYLLKRHPYQVRLYAFGASIAMTGFLMRHHIQSFTGLRSNFMVLAIGGSGTGKTLIRNGLLDILDYVQQTNLYAQRLGSYQGCVDRLQKNSGSLFLIQDEARYELKSNRNPNVTNAEMRTEEFKLTVFSCPPNFTPDVIKNSEPLVIPQPFFSEFSISTHDMLRSFSPSDVTKGLLPRYLLLTTYVPFFDENPSLSFEMPSSLKKLLNPFKEAPKYERLKALFTEDAYALFKEFKGCVQQHRQKLFETSHYSRFDAILARLPEHATKLSLLGAKESIVGYDISVEALSWGIAVSLFSFKNLVYIIKNNIYENQVEEYHHRVFSTIHTYSGGKWIRKREILRKTQFLKVRDLDDILVRLQEEEMIEIRQHTKNTFLIRSLEKGEKK